MSNAANGVTMVSMNTKVKFFLSIIGAAIIAIVLYTVLHELGHSVVAVACGAELTGFSIVNAKMSYEGGSFNQVTNSLLYVAGLTLPILIVFVLLCFYRQNKEGIPYHCLYLMLSMITVFSSLAWIFLPLVSLFEALPAGDDVTMFMAASGISPVIVMLGASLTILFMVWFVMRRGLFSSFNRVVKATNTRTKGSLTRKDQ